MSLFTQVAIHRMDGDLTVKGQLFCPPPQQLHRILSEPQHFQWSGCVSSVALALRSKSVFDVLQSLHGRYYQVA
jgi:hypothetical protein